MLRKRLKSGCAKNENEGVQEKVIPGNVQQHEADAMNHCDD